MNSFSSYRDDPIFKAAAYDYAQALQDYLDGKIKEKILEEKYNANVDGETGLFAFFYGNNIFELFSSLLHLYDLNLERRKDEPYLIGDEELRPAAKEFLIVLQKLIEENLPVAPEDPAKKETPPTPPPPPPS